jgi:hypothetical protein
MHGSRLQVYRYQGQSINHFSLHLRIDKNAMKDAYHVGVAALTASWQCFSDSGYQRRNVTRKSFCMDVIRDSRFQQRYDLADAVNVNEGFGPSPLRHIHMDEGVNMHDVPRGPDQHNLPPQV